MRKPSVNKTAPAPPPTLNFKTLSWCLKNSNETSVKNPPMLRKEKNCLSPESIKRQDNLKIVMLLNLSTITSVSKFSILSLFNSYGTQKESSSNNLYIDFWFRVILLGGIRCVSFLRGQRVQRLPDNWDDNFPIAAWDQTTSGSVIKTVVRKENYSII